MLFARRGLIRWLGSLDVEDNEATSTGNFRRHRNYSCAAASEQVYFDRDIGSLFITSLLHFQMPGFEIPNPEALPDNIQLLPFYNSILYVDQYFDAMIKRIIEYLQPVRRR